MAWGALLRWVLPLGAALVAAAHGAPIVLSLPADTTLEAGATVRLPVRTTEMTAADGVTAFEMRVLYPADVLDYGTVEFSPLLPAGMSGKNLLSDGVVAVVWASGGDRIVGSGPLFYLVCTVKATVPDQTTRDMKIAYNGDKHFFLNEGSPQATAQNGIIRVHNPNVPPVDAVAEVPEPAVARVRAWPNPFNGGTTIALVGLWAAATAAGGPWRGALVDALGRVVRRWTMPPDGRWGWDGRDDAGRPVSSGVYIAILAQGERTLSVKLALSR